MRRSSASSAARTVSAVPPRRSATRRGSRQKARRQHRRLRYPQPRPSDPRQTVRLGADHARVGDRDRRIAEHVDMLPDVIARDRRRRAGRLRLGRRAMASEPTTRASVCSRSRCALCMSASAASSNAASARRPRTAPRPTVQLRPRAPGGPRVAPRRSRARARSRGGRPRGTRPSPPRGPPRRSSTLSCDRAQVFPRGREHEPRDPAHLRPHVTGRAVQPAAASRRRPPPRRESAMSSAASTSCRNGPRSGARAAATRAS